MQKPAEKFPTVEGSQRKCHIPLLLWLNSSYLGVSVFTMPGRLPSKLAVNCHHFVYFKMWQD